MNISNHNLVKIDIKHTNIIGKYTKCGLGTPGSSINKTDIHDITTIVLKVTLITITLILTKFG